jgi:hypothetical protein
VAEALAVIELLDERIAPLDRELGPLARADRRVSLLTTIPGIGPVLGLTIAAEIGDVARFASRRKADRLLRPRAAGQAVGPALPLGRAVEGWLADTALRRRRGGPGRPARDEPLAPPLLGRQGADRQGESRPSRPSPARCSSPAGTCSAANSPSRRRHPHPSCPGKLPLLSGRLTARTRIEKPGQLPSEMVGRERRKRK